MHDVSRRMVLAGVAAGMEIFNDVQSQNDVINLNNTLNQVKNTPPDLSTFLTTSTGLYKLRMTLVAQTLPDVPSSVILTLDDAVIRAEWIIWTTRNRLAVEPLILPGGHSPMLAQPVALARTLDRLSAGASPT